MRPKPTTFVGQGGNVRNFLVMILPHIILYAVVIENTLERLVKLPERQK